MDIYISSLLFNSRYSFFDNIILIVLYTPVASLTIRNIPNIYDK